MELKEKKDAILYMWFRVNSTLEKHLSRLTKLPKWADKKGYKSLDDLKKTYRERLNFEFNTIRNMGFCSYFLIVADGIEFCKKEDLPVGPGRGSAAGCLCAYLLNITKIDPIKYDLLFERFLNPDRISMPDIDVDYSQEYRYKIKEYFAKKYGTDKVSSIATFNRMKIRAAIRDIVRSMNLGGSTSESFRLADRIVKTLPDSGDAPELSFEEALEYDSFRAYLDQYPVLGERIRQYEKLLRQTSMHAAGVLISSSRFDDYLPMMVDKKGMTVTAYDGDTVEKLGYLKLDTLGLKNLDVIKACKRNIRRIRGDIPSQMSLSGIEIDPQETQRVIWKKINQLPDGAKKRASKAYHLLREGKTLGVFQCEMDVTADLLKRIKCNSIEDIADVIALIRPGPRSAGSTDIYIARKRKEEEISYIHKFEDFPESIQEVVKDPARHHEIPDIIEDCEKYLKDGVEGLRAVDSKKRHAEDIKNADKDQSYFTVAPKVCMWLEKLENPERDHFDLSCISAICDKTQGLPLFQEQLMRIATRCAGFTKGKSDELRKAVGKKIAAKIKEIGELFISGMQTGTDDLNPTGVSYRTAQYIWYKFILPYGSYGFNLSHSVAYSFISYETAYLKANYPGEFYAALLSHESDQEKINTIIAEAKVAGIRFTPPNVNESTESFEIVDQNTITYALTLMKGVGDKAVKKIVDNRPYSNMVDFIGRAKCNANVTKTLIKGGAFDNAFENEKVSRKNYFDFFEDCRKKLKRRTERILKETLLRKYGYSTRRKLSTKEKEEAKAAGTYMTPTERFKFLMATNEDFKRDWEKEYTKQVSIYEYDWFNPVTEMNNKTKEVKAVERESGDDRSHWTDEEIFDFEEQIYGTTISGHRLDPYKKSEDNFNKNIERKPGYDKHVLSEDLERWKKDQEVFLYVLGSELKLKLPYRKDPSQVRRIYDIEDRFGKGQITVFDSKYREILQKFDNSGPLHLLDTYGLKPVMIIKCKVNEYNNRRSLLLENVVKWINKDESLERLEQRKNIELYGKENPNE